MRVAKLERMIDANSFILSYRSDIPSKEAVLLLHGFPADKGNKNLDLACALSEQIGLDTFVLHYRGLGDSPGSFSFTHSVVESIAVAKTLLADSSYQKLHLFGHSWGGLVAINVYNTLAEYAGKLILLNPYSQFPVANEASTQISNVISTSPKLFGDATKTQILDDLFQVSKKYSPQDGVSKLHGISGDLFVFQSAIDSEVLPASTNELIKLFSVEPAYLVVDLDHSASDRDLLIKIVLSAFGRPTCFAS